MLKKLICWLIGHDLWYTNEPLDGTVLEIEYSHCERCKNYSTVTGVFRQ